MDVYLRAKFEVSSLILTSFKQEGGSNFITPLLPPQNEPLKNPPRYPDTQIPRVKIYVKKLTEKYEH